MWDQEKLQKLIYALQRRQDPPASDPSSDPQSQRAPTNDSMRLSQAAELVELASFADAIASDLREESVQLRVPVLSRRNFRRPAVALPAELLSDIFQYGCFRLPGEPSVNIRSEVYNSRVHRPTRQSITATCSSWRRTAIATTVLWNSIDVQLVKNTPVVPRLGLLQLELERSGSRPLKLRLAIIGSPIPWDTFSQTIRDALPRCQTIHVDSTSKGILASLLGPDTASLPHLLSFVNHARITGFGYGYPLNLDYDFRTAPLLRNISIENRVHTLHLSPSQAITRLEFGPTVPFSCAVSAIQNCSQLRELKWNMEDLDQLPSNLSSLRLPLLEYLEYHEGSGGELHGDIISYFIAPRLSTLSVSLTGPPSVDVTQHFPAVRHFVITSGHFTDLDFLLESLAQFYMLEVVDIGDFGLSESVLEGLLQRDADGAWAILPHMKHLVFSYPVDPDLARRLLDARNARQAGDPGLTIAFRVDDYVISDQLLALSWVVPFDASNPFQIDEW